MSEQYRSKLLAQSGKVTRGMGSAYTQNQHLAGAADPESAAMLAGMDPDEARKRAEQMDLRKAEVEDARRDLLYAVDSEGYVAPGNIDKATSMQLLSWAGELKTWREKQIDKESDEMIRGTFDTSVPVDDPMYNPMDDTARKKRVEKDLKPLDFESMVFRGYCEQVVPLRQNFEVVYRTITTRQGMWLEMMLTDLGDYSVQYGRHWFSLCQVAVSLQTINGKPIGPSLSGFTDVGQKDDFKKALDQKMKFLGNLPSVLTDDLIVQFMWFNGRVRKLLAGDVASKVGNS